MRARWPGAGGERSMMRARALAGSAVALAVFAGATARMHASPTAIQARLEAAIVSKLPQFVEWPERALAARPSVDVCVVSPEPLDADLRELVEGDVVAGRRVTVRRVDRDPDVDRCHVLFLASELTTERRTLLQRASSLPILTVGDAPRFLDDGGIVQLRLVDGRVRFDVNAAAAQRVGLRISSQLLQLAASVRSGLP